MFQILRLFSLLLNRATFRDIDPSSGEVILPVDLLLYLHRRDDGTYAPLVATEGNRINWWSTTAIGVPVGKYGLSIVLSR